MCTHVPPHTHIHTHTYHSQEIAMTLTVVISRQSGLMGDFDLPPYSSSSWLAVWFRGCYLCSVSSSIRWSHNNPCLGVLLGSAHEIIHIKAWEQCQACIITDSINTTTVIIFLGLLQGGPCCFLNLVIYICVYVYFYFIYFKIYFLHIYVYLHMHYIVWL